MLAVMLTLPAPALSVPCKSISAALMMIFPPLVATDFPLPIARVPVPVLFASAVKVAVPPARVMLPDAVMPPLLVTDTLPLPDWLISVIVSSADALVKLKDEMFPDKVVTLLADEVRLAVAEVSPSIRKPAAVIEPTVCVIDPPPTVSRVTFPAVLITVLPPQFSAMRVPPKLRKRMSPVAEAPPMLVVASSPDKIPGIPPLPVPIRFIAPEPVLVILGPDDNWIP